MHVCMCICTDYRLYMHACMYACVHVQITSINVSLAPCKKYRAYVSAYIYIYIYIYMHARTHTHTHTHTYYIYARKHTHRLMHNHICVTYGQQIGPEALSRWQHPLHQVCMYVCVYMYT